MRILFPFLFFSFFLSPLFSQAQEQKDDYYDDSFLRYEDRTYQPSIKTVQFHKVNDPLTLPVIGLNNGEQLQLSFDDLDSEYQDYTYTVIHCDRNWVPTNIPSNEYIDGFTEETILNYDFSFNTTQQFVHYSVTFPRPEFNLKLSGNYILLVYKDFNQQKPIISRRFRVYENLVKLQAESRLPMVIDKRRTHHQINIVLDHSNYDIRNPLRDIAIHVQQNYRWDNIKTDLKPIFIKEQKLIYDNMGDVLFEGSNEFRWLDTRSLRYQPENVSYMWYDPDSMKNHIFMLEDKIFSKAHYVTEPDLNGAFYIEVREGSDYDQEADYTLVHFSIKYPMPIMDGGLYLFGGLTEWQIKPQYRMEYNYKNETYECSAYFKQGYYNYQYIYLRDGQTVGETEPSESSFFEARQIYTFYVYHAEMSSRYDRLIGHAIISSQN